MLFYSWADVISLDRLLENAEVQVPEVADQQRRAVRRMFDLADGPACLWRRLAGHFAEAIAACGESCGICLKRDIVGDARPAAGATGRQEPKRARQKSDEAFADTGLFERLRALRKKLADAHKVPAFVIFSDRSLQDMAARQPQTRDEFLDVHGVGQKKLEEYGDSFIAEIIRQR